MLHTLYEPSIGPLMHLTPIVAEVMILLGGGGGVHMCEPVFSLTLSFCRQTKEEVAWKKCNLYHTQRTHTTSTSGLLFFFILFFFPFFLALFDSLLHYY